jgi:hypothetical protein
MRAEPTEYCLPDPDSLGDDLSFATVEEGRAWIAARAAHEHAEVVARSSGERGAAAVRSRAM